MSPSFTDRLTHVLCIATLLALSAGPVRGAPAPADEQPKFDVMEYAVEGNTRLSDIDIERAVTPYLGEGKTLRDVEAARTALEAAYNRAGYLTIVVSIPEQDVGGGVVTLNVLEGQVDRVRVKGAGYHLPSGIRARVPELAAGNVPYFPEVQRQLDALNRGADLRATPVLKAGRTPGTVEVQLEVEDELPLHGSVELSNRQSANTTPMRLSGSLRYDNLWQLGHSASLTLQSSPQKLDEVRTAAGTYVFPVRDSDALVLYSVISRSKFATIAGAPGLGVLGDSNIYGIRYAFGLPGFALEDGSFSQSLTLGLDYKDIKQTLLVDDVRDQTPISYAPVVVNYGANWQGATSTTRLDVAATHGVRGLFNSQDAEFDAKRRGALASFFVLRAGLSHAETIERWTLSGKVEAQVASGRLINTEQFAAGGADTVRGYLESERLGDDAWRWALEARTPKFAVVKESPLRLVGLAFYEGARLRTRGADPVLESPWQLIRGAGLGLRLSGFRGTSFDLDLARALDDAEITKAGDYRAHARLMWEF